MSKTGNFKQLTPWQKALFLTGAVFLLLYFALGLIFLFKSNLPIPMSPTLRTVFGIALIAYAVFRMARLFSSLKDDEQ